MRKTDGLTMTEALRQAIEASGLTYSELERETGVLRPSIWRFMHRMQSLHLDAADKLATYLGIRVVLPKRKRG